MDINALSHQALPMTAGDVVTPREDAAQNRDIVQAVKALNASEMFGQDNELVYQMDRQVHRMVARIVNRKTQEVISQVPPEYVLRLSEDLRGSGGG